MMALKLLITYLTLIAVTHSQKNTSNLFGSGTKLLQGSSKLLGGDKLVENGNKLLGGGASLLGGGGKALEKLNHDVQDEIAAVKQPIAKAAASAVFSQCDNVKQLLGLKYEQLEGEKEPDVNSLTLKYISNAINVSYNINSAAELIAQDRQYNDEDTLIIYIHGFTDDPGKASFGNVSEALYKRGLNNVLALDVGQLLRWLYLRSTTYVRFAGEKLGEVLAAMVHKGVKSSSIHIVGHSLGSHIASFTGKSFTNLTGHKVGRITALDPAGPCFAQVESELRIRYTDAEYVDVIHTNAGLLGMEEPVGHADYYPNGGSEQPECLLSISCSHSRAWLLFAESTINPDAFPAVRCDSWTAFQNGSCHKEISYMGFPSRHGTRGIYYLQTAGESPYSLGMRGIMYEEEEGIVRSLLNGK
ncbi:pancreatic triacylglycerol lipase [Aphomia sociella]